MPRKAVELDRSRTPLIGAVVVVVGLAFTTGAIMWGTSDTGQIDVSATIAGSQNSKDDTTPAVPAATNEHSALPNGGLIPQSSEGTPAPEPIVTEETATNTEEILEGEETPEDSESVETAAE